MRYSELGPHEFSEMRVVPEILVVDYLYSDIDSNKTIKVPIPADTLVLAVIHQNTVAFSSGGSAMTIGDSANAANWTGTNDTAVTLNKVMTSLVAGETNAAGKYYASTDYIKITFSMGLTAGAGRLFIWMIPNPAAGWRVPAAGDQDYVYPDYPTDRP
jgi:hypothetical protein